MEEHSSGLVARLVESAPKDRLGGHALILSSPCTDMVQDSKLRRTMRQRDPDSPGVVIWPPVLYGLAFLLGLALEWIAPLGRLPHLPARLLGAVLFLAGVALARSGERAMREAGTNIHPDQPALALVTGGPFRFTRNPLYVALTLLYAGVALLVPALWPLALLVPVLAVMHWGVVQREERYLERKFGDSYRAYIARVRRWV